MKVTTDSERARKSQQLVLELLLSDMRETEYTRHNELDEWAARIDAWRRTGIDVCAYFNNDS